MVQKRQFAGVWLCTSFAAILTLLVGCSGESTTDTSSAAPVEDSRLVGKWSMQSGVTLENGHEVTMENKYEFRSDGTFTNVSDSKLLNGDTGEPFYTSITTETGSWTVDGEQTCWTTTDAVLTEFETFTDLITREMVEEGLAEQTPPECFTIATADESAIRLQPSAGGEALTLTRRE